MSSLPYPGSAGSMPSIGVEAAAPRSIGEPSERRWPLEFTGSGSEYLRIWIVNQLLTIVTLGIYYPWAKVRKLRYFRGNTLLAGHAFDFHGDPKRMLRGYALMAVLFIVYSAAGRFSPVAGFIALLFIAAIWPALFRASMRFRLANTSWRALRFRFEGSTGGAYRAMLAIFVPALLLFGVIGALAPRAGAPARELPVFAGLVVGGITLAMLALMPYFFWLVKRYQHDHYAFASLRTKFDARPRAFYGLYLKLAGVMFAAMLAFGALAATAMFFASGASKRTAGVVAIATVLLFYVALILLVQPFAVSRMQNLVWSRTSAGPGLRFDSGLRYWPLVGLTLKNWLLILLTLGLYWPFAAVATARMRLQAVSVVSSLDLDDFTDRVRERHEDATGDAAGDLFDIDIGL